MMDLMERNRGGFPVGEMMVLAALPSVDHFKSGLTEQWIREKMKDHTNVIILDSLTEIEDKSFDDSYIKFLNNGHSGAFTPEKSLRVHRLKERVGDQLGDVNFEVPYRLEIFYNHMTKKEKKAKREKEKARRAGKWIPPEKKEAKVSGLLSGIIAKGKHAKPNRI